MTLDSPLKKYDFIIIGGGSGGLRSSRLLAKQGFNVAVVENSVMGGTCVNLGCVPKKLFVYAAKYNDDIENSKYFGHSFNDNKFSWKKLLINKNNHIKKLNSIFENLLNSNNIEIINGNAKFIDENSIIVNGKKYTASNFIVAVGSTPKKLDIPGNEHCLYSNDIFFLEKLPKKIVIIGSGYIAIEFACILSNLGVDVTLLARKNRILASFDREITNSLLEYLNNSNKNIKILLDTIATQIIKDKKTNIETYNIEIETCLNNGKKIKKILKTNSVLAATGRMANTKQLGLSNAGIDVNEDEEIIVNKTFLTSNKNVYAIGDVIGTPNLTPVAIRQAETLVKNLTNKKNNTLNYEKIPTAIFSIPEIASIGLTEESAKEKKINAYVYKSKFMDMKKSFANNNNDSVAPTIIKMIVGKDDNKILGIHMIGESASEIIQIAAVAIENNLTKEQLDKVIALHPSNAEELVTMKEFEYEI